MKYVRSLDSFRTFAVLTVIVGHWVPFSTNSIITYVPLGAIGVTMFFVLSGFLITTILLGGREIILEKKVRISRVLTTFYIRSVSTPFLG